MKRTDLTKIPEGHLQRYEWTKATRGGLAAKASALLRILWPITLGGVGATTATVRQQRYCHGN